MVRVGLQCHRGKNKIKRTEQLQYITYYYILTYIFIYNKFLYFIKSDIMLSTTFQEDRVRYVVSLPCTGVLISP